MTQSGTAASAGLFASGRALLQSLADILYTRLELLGVELEEDTARIVLSLRYSLAALFLGGLGLAFGGLALLIAAWESYRLPVALLLAAIFLVAGALAALAARRIAHAKPRFLDATLGVLKKDASQLAPPV